MKTEDSRQHVCELFEKLFLSTLSGAERSEEGMKVKIPQKEIHFILRVGEEEESFKKATKFYVNFTSGTAIAVAVAKEFHLIYKWT